MWPPVLRGPVEGLQDQAKLVLATDQLGSEAGDAAGLYRPHAESALGSKGCDGLRLALGLDWLPRAVLDDTSGQLFRESADDHLSRVGPLVEAGRDVDGVTAHQELAVGARARPRFPWIYTYTKRQGRCRARPGGD